MNSGGSKVALEKCAAQVSEWLQRRPGAICWVCGPSGTGKSAAVRSALSAHNALASTHHVFLELSTANPDRCLERAYSTQNSKHLTRPVSTAQIFELLDEAEVLFVDALDTIQSLSEKTLHEVTDLRLRLVLAACAARRWPKLASIVTSQYRPPGSLPADSLRVFEISSSEVPQIPAEWLPNSGPPTALELLAWPREASSGWLLGLMTGNATTEVSLSTPENVGTVLNNATRSGLVERLDWDSASEWFQVPNALRSLVLTQNRVAVVRKVIRETLVSDRLPAHLDLAAADDPELYRNLMERLLDLLLEDGDLQSAVLCYWQTLGNFSQLRKDGAIHFGARVCRKLNEGRDPDEISPRLRDIEGCWAVINDWGQFALCSGDARMSTSAAEAAYDLAQKQESFDKSVLATHVADAVLVKGQLHDALRWAKQGWEYATNALRKFEGMPTSEVMDAYDHAGGTLGKILLYLDGAIGGKQALEELVQRHQYARQALENFNRVAVVKVPGPTAPVDPEQLLNGRLAAAIALSEKRLDDTERIVRTRMAAMRAAETRSDIGVQLQTLLLRAQLEGGKRNEARKLLSQLRTLAEERDDSARACELAVLAAEMILAEGDAQSSLSMTEDYLLRAVHCGLGLHWIDLMRVRSRALVALERIGDARKAAEAAILGAGHEQSFGSDLSGACSTGYRSGLEKAVDAIHAAGGEVGESVLAALKPTLNWEQTRRSSRPPTPMPERAKGADRRMQLHEAALNVVENYRTRGVPFALCLRKFDFTILHGPMEYGPRYLESVLREAIQPEADVITIQEHSDIPGYSGSGTQFDRDAPALLVENEKW